MRLATSHEIRLNDYTLWADAAQPQQLVVAGPVASVAEQIRQDWGALCATPDGRRLVWELLTTDSALVRQQDSEEVAERLSIPRTPE